MSFRPLPESCSPLFKSRHVRFPAKPAPFYTGLAWQATGVPLYKLPSKGNTVIHINEQRFLRNFETLTQIGRSVDAGITHPAFSQAHAEARQVLSCRREPDLRLCAIFAHFYVTDCAYIAQSIFSREPALHILTYRPLLYLVIFQHVSHNTTPRFYHVLIYWHGICCHGSMTS